MTTLLQLNARFIEEKNTYIFANCPAYDGTSTLGVQIVADKIRQRWTAEEDVWL